MSVQDDVSQIRSRLSDATTQITRLLADGQPTSTAAQLSAIQTKLNALDAEFAAAQVEFGTVSSLLQTYIGTDITPDVPDFDDQLSILLALDQDCAPTYNIFCVMEKLLTDFATLLDNRFRPEYITALQARVHSSFDGTNDDVDIPTYRLFEIIERIDEPCPPGQSAVECLINLTDTTDRPIPEISEALKKRIIDEVALIVGFPYTGRDAGSIAYPVASGQPWDNPSVTARQLWDGVPFVYDRVGAAQYAISRTIENFEGTLFPSGMGDLTATVQGTVNGVFDDYFLKHKEGVTGSAIFISEAFYKGGKLPMVSAIPPALECDGSVSNATTGWRVCCGNQEATLSWKYHVGITQYFDDVSSDSQFIGAIDYNFLQERIRFGETQGAEIGGGSWKPNTNKNELYSLFATGGNLEAIDTGDYIFIDQNLANPAGPGSHGFIIVGWGTAPDCPNGLNAQV